MPNSTQQGSKMDAQAQKPTNTEGFEGSEQLEDENVSERVKILLSSGVQWLSNLGDLLNAETNLMVASLSRFFMLSILFAQTIVIFVVLTFIFIGLALHEIYELDALELSAVGLVAAGIIVVILKKFMRRVRKNLLPVASIEQIQTGLSDIIATINSNSESAPDKTRNNDDKK
ncbi:phage holin family protein [Reinekea sp.]|jgi:hypothetical protein|uniref:phage holin family protein n=1 Tax=Reinekea sp. TaxID=1970455 RepID=UPI00398A1181